jgi:hypothetical protein
MPLQPVKCQCCGARLPVEGRGRPRRFCSDACRKQAFRERADEPTLSVPRWALAALALELLQSSDEHSRALGRLLRRGDLRALYRALQKAKAGKLRPS